MKVRREIGGRRIKMGYRKQEEMGVHRMEKGEGGQRNDAVVAM